MKTSDFYYDLPQELIAQTPLDRRDASRLLTLDKHTGNIIIFMSCPNFCARGTVWF